MGDLVGGTVRAAAAAERKKFGEEDRRPSTKYDQLVTVHDRRGLGQTARVKGRRPQKATSWPSGTVGDGETNEVGTAAVVRGEPVG